MRTPPVDSASRPSKSSSSLPLCPSLLPQAILAVRCEEVAIDSHHRAPSRDRIKIDSLRPLRLVWRLCCFIIA
jgi:hypothetical protein